MQATPIESAIYGRARAIVQGLIRTRRAGHKGVVDRGMLKLECTKGGYYWLSLDGGRLHRGSALIEAEELQPKFINAMERAGRE
jgi:hypothetical protein